MVYARQHQRQNQGGEIMNEVYGLDVSRWQNNISTPEDMDFTKAYTQGARFVFIKSSQANYKDRDIIVNWDNAKNANLLRGAYHFLTWDIDAKKQAEYAWSIIENRTLSGSSLSNFGRWTYRYSLFSTKDWCLSSSPLFHTLS